LGFAEGEGFNSRSRGRPPSVSQKKKKKKRALVGRLRKKKKERGFSCQKRGCLYGSRRGVGDMLLLHGGRKRKKKKGKGGRNFSALEMDIILRT